MSSGWRVVKLLKVASLLSVGSIFISLVLLQQKLSNLKEPRWKYNQNTRDKSGKGIASIESKLNPDIFDYTPRCSFAQRRQHVNNTCARLQLDRTFHPNLRHFLHHVITDDKHKLLYCFIPKAACTTWKTVLANYTDVIQDNWRRKLVQEDNIGINVHSATDLESIGLPLLMSSKYSDSDIRYRLQHYLKLIIVRHPFERLLSTYREKFQKQFYKRSIVQHVAKHYANIQNTSRDHLKPGMIPFRAFIDFIVQDHAKVSDEHWDTYADLCQPCQINYDVIMKVETMPQDSPYILARLTGSDVNRGGADINKFNSFADSDTTLEMFKDLPRDVVNSLRTIYGKDFDMFGYGWSLNQSRAVCETETERNTCC